MNTATKALLAVWLATPLLSVADDQPKLSCIKDISYNQAFLTRYPNAAAACREVVMRDGEMWARFDADVVAVNGNQITADFMDPYENAVGTVTFTASEEARLTVNGKEEKFADVRKGDSLTFWMPAKRLSFYATPVTSASNQFALVDRTTKER